MARAYSGKGIDRALEKRLTALVNSRESRLLVGGGRGIERESLRVTPEGRIAATPHPRALGSALTHPSITTDYSESLIELVTPPFTDCVSLWQFLGELHHFVYSNIGDELLWAASMPCEIGSEDDIPIAQYGASFRGRIKTIYRHGLKIRYGALMQAISGVHFNYSLPAAFWPLYQDIRRATAASRWEVTDTGSPGDFMTTSYLELIRGYRRHGWLVSYLFGASPAMCRSFLPEAAGDDLLPLGADSVLGRYATSLRMSDMGYRNRNQDAARVPVNDLTGYLQALRKAVHEPNETFAALGVRVDGEYQQLSGNTLQIENEYYSYIRPKRSLHPGERTLHALQRGGIEYVEVRSLDNSMQDVVGVNLHKLHFLEAFLQLLLLKGSPPIDEAEDAALDRNHLTVARRGREPGLLLERDGHQVSLSDWSHELLDSMQGVCELLDAHHAGAPYQAALAAQRAKLEDVALTPSARIAEDMRTRGDGFAATALHYSQRHRTELAQLWPNAAAAERRFAQEAADSWREAQAVEATQSGTFEAYLQQYLAD